MMKLCKLSLVTLKKRWAIFTGITPTLYLLALPAEAVERFGIRIH